MINQLLTSTFSPLLQNILTGGLAYLDPGSGSFIIQILIATLVGGLFIVKSYWQKITGFFRNMFSRREGDKEE
jgi:hypothetical protein